MTYTLHRPDGSVILATEEQTAIIDAARGTKDSLLISALAGSAKTTTLEFLAKYMPLVPMLSLAFNKRIATEMEARLPGHVLCKTMNAIGHKTWCQAIGKSRPTLDSAKNKRLLFEEIGSLPRADKAEAFSLFSETLRAISAAKLNGYVPEEGIPSHAKHLLTTEEFFSSLEDEVPQGLVNTVLRRSIAEAYQGTIDFDDQVYMPTLFGGSYPKFPVVLVDEAQDLSPLNHEMLKRLSGDRLIAVGDPWQSIYAFRGATVGSMERLKETFSMKEMALTVSFRCSQRVVENAQFRVPHMRAAPSAALGRVEDFEAWDIACIPEGSAIICRNNAPLFDCAMALLKAGRSVHLVGRELGPSLIKALRKLGPEDLPRDRVLHAIGEWEREKLLGAKNPGAITDRADCLRVLAGFGETLRAAIHHAEHIFAAEGTIQLLSGHKAKGLEWDTVFHLDSWRIPSPWASGPDLEQEQNIRYVIETRAKRNLFRISMEGFAQGGLTQDPAAPAGIRESEYAPE